MISVTQCKTNINHVRQLLRDSTPLLKLLNRGSCITAQAGQLQPINTAAFPDPIQ